MNYINEHNTVDDFSASEGVRYVPSHAQGNIMHPDCENGIVSSINSKVVFVRYIRNNVLQETAQETDPRDLIKMKAS
jgi:hypothetical protein